MKKTKKSRAAKPTRDLPAKAVSAKTAKGVRGGASTEHISLAAAKVEVEYKPQK